MTDQIIRSRGGTQIVRSAERSNLVRKAAATRVIRDGRGPRGQAAAQDGFWSLMNNLGPGEEVPLGPWEHPATYTRIKAGSFSGFAAQQTLLVRQYRFVGMTPTLIATASLQVGPGAGVWVDDIATPLVFLENDMAKLALPNPADSHASDVSVSLGSEP